MTITIKTWFLVKEFNENERYAISVCDSETIVRETEKAILVKWVTEFGTITRWIPRSALMIEADFAAADARREVALKNHAELVSFAKANGIKARVNSKTGAILKALADVGITEYMGKKIQYMGGSVKRANYQLV
ncbi:hypothetical protein FACS18949_17560 [Clostridia bacterium]|nr:hypothetical protein FACS18949_17560 [Clostridia bacterium]